MRTARAAAMVTWVYARRAITTHRDALKAYGAS